MKHVVICGSYGTPNTGDELILENLLDTFKNEQVSVLSSHPEITQELYGVPCFSGVHWRDLNDSNKPYYPHPITPKEEEVIKTADLVIVGGGGLLGHHVTFAEEKIDFANNNGIPCMVYGVGASMIELKFAGLQKEYLNKFDYITVRDDNSAAGLRKANTNTPILTTADPMYRYETSKSDTKWEPKDDGKLNVGICLHRGRLSPDAQKKFAKILDGLTEEYNLYFLPFSYEYLYGIADYSAEKEVLDLMEKKIEIIDTSKMLPREITGVISKLDILASSRLHAMFTAAVSGVPFISFGFAGSKFEIHAEMLQQTKCNDFFSLPEALKKAMVAPSMKPLVKKLQKKEKLNEYIARGLMK